VKTRTVFVDGAPDNNSTDGTDALTRRTLPLGGAGTVEVLVSFALAWTGVPLANAVLAVCAYRFFNLWLPLLPAAIGLRHLKRWRDVVSEPR